MELFIENAEIPILIIYDLNKINWGQFEIKNTLEKIEQLSAGLVALGHPLSVIPVYDTHLSDLLKPYPPEDFILFNLCEELPGLPHSSGKVGEIIEGMGYHHTGPGASILTFSQDKTNVKRLAEQHGIPTPPWHIYYSINEDGWRHYPAIVKPTLEHCSVGIDSHAVVSDHHELTHRIKYVIDTFNQPALVEDFIDGREFRISVIGNGNSAHMLSPAEIDFSHFNNLTERLLSYDSKMNPDSRFYQKVKLNLNPDLKPDELLNLKTLALKVFQILECRDYAGFDFRLKDGIFYLLDANPDPEFSPECSMVLGAEKEGYSFASLASYIVKQAARRHPVFTSLF